MASQKITNTGLALFVNLLRNSGQAVCKYLQIGTGTTAAAATDTALQTPTNDARVAGTQSSITTTVTNDTLQNVGTITSGTVGTTAITECGEFDAAGSGTPATGGNMATRATFAAVNLNQGDSIQITTKTKLVDNS